MTKAGNRGRVAGCGLRVAGGRQRVAGCEVLIASWDLVYRVGTCIPPFSGITVPALFDNDGSGMDMIGGTGKTLIKKNLDSVQLNQPDQQIT